jgi:5-methylcytosine-specific restriction endonuclease McrA
LFFVEMAWAGMSWQMHHFHPFNKDQTPRHFMSSILNKSVVLVLNRNWQAINVHTPQEAFCMMATNVATGLEIEGEDQIRPVKWDEWIRLPVRPEDQFVRTVHGQIRVPTVIVAVNLARVPKNRPILSARGIRQRDGNRCQYTGAVLKPEEGSIDHVVPRSRGGPNSWDNCVWASKRVNAHKATGSHKRSGSGCWRRPGHRGNCRSRS